MYLSSTNLAEYRTGAARQALNRLVNTDEARRVQSEISELRSARGVNSAWGHTMH